MKIRRNRVQSMINDEVYDALTDAAGKGGVTVSDFINELLKQHFGIK